MLRLLENYVHFSCYAERDRRRIEKVATGTTLMLSRDPVERRIELLWLEGPRKFSMWRGVPPLFPGHRCSLTPFMPARHKGRGAYHAPHRDIWVLPP